MCFRSIYKKIMRMQQKIKLQNVYKEFIIQEEGISKI